ncbi:hypothetical protein LPJ60_000449 [Coemansia sp. RSA 2675]|nr:hypothetical protein LPJ60_000449 [Coemansia sp. RSA 2675]
MDSSSSGTSQAGISPANSVGPLKKKQTSSAAEIGPCTSSDDTAETDALSAPVELGGVAFGSRMLSSDRNVFEHNAWDHVEPDSAHYKYAEEQIRLHREHPVPENERGKSANSSYSPPLRTMLRTNHSYNENPASYWNSFYENNKDKFFKDRHWLRVEFSELFEWTNSRTSAEGEQSLPGATGEAAEPLTPSVASAAAASEKFNIMEVGCGAGNAVFPLLADVYDPRLFVYACDYSKTAVDVVKATEAYDESRCKAFVWDLSSTELPSEVAPGSIDIMLMIFVFSALHPDQWSQAVENAYRVLKPGGVLLFRDYGRNDLTQLRFKKARLLGENLYIRGDGTRVYFFTNEELAEVFGKRFAIEQNAIDRRLLVNRKRELKMYRVWLQAKFRKPISAD